MIQSYFKFFRLIQKFKSKELIGKFMNTSYHSVNYFNKVLIQYIYLSFVKNDLVKIEQMPKVFSQLEKIGAFIDENLKDIDILDCNAGNHGCCCAMVFPETTRTPGRKPVFLQKLQLEIGMLFL